MSLTFSEYSAKHPDKAGYLRIGHVVLAFPPTDILTNRTVNNERLTTLRGRNDMVKKTGQARWDVTVRWTALLDSTTDDLATQYRQWEDLRTILAIFHAAPFVEVENGYIRQVLADLDPDNQTIGTSSVRMGFALRQINISTHNDIVDGLDVALTMTLFNYFPYSSDFGYTGAEGQSTDAWLCPEFENYINQWKQRNLDTTHASDGSGFDGAPITNWMQQIPGTLKFRWRKYKTIKIGPAVATGVSNAAVAQMNQAQVQPLTPTGKVTDQISGDGQYDALITQYAQQYNVSPAIVKAIMWHESRFKPQAIQPNYKGGGSASSTKAQLSFILQDPDGGLAYVNAYTAQNLNQKGTTFAPDLGLMQVNWKNTRKLNPALRPIDMFRPETAIAMGCQILASMYAAGMPRDQVYWYGTGPDPKGTKFDAAAQEFQKEVLQQYQLYLTNFDTTGTSKPTSPLAPPASQASASQISQLPTNVTNGLAQGLLPGDTLSANQVQEVLAMLADGWFYDHCVNEVAFFYQEQQMTLTDNEHGDIANGYGLFPQQFSILFTNNLAQIPLAAYQYPTYQHIGSTSSAFSILMMSKGTRDSEEQEPVHNGINVLSGASELLESQYLRLRNQWRRISSIHRMQAFYVENQILNMLGIRGTVIDSINSSTLPNLSDTAQVQVNGTQYENIFEVSTPFQLNSIDGGGQTAAQNIVNSGQLSSLTSNEASTVVEMTQFSKGRAAGDYTILDQFLLKLGAMPNMSFASFSSLADSGASTAQVTMLMSPFSNGTDIAAYPPINTRLQSAQQTGKLTLGDVLLIQTITNNNSTSTITSEVADEADILNQSAINASAALATQLINAAGTAKIQAVYDAVFPLLASNDATFATEINTLSKSPRFSSQFSGNVTPTGPGTDSMNVGHGAYNDLGLTDLLTPAGKDNNPGSYFFDHRQDYLSVVRTNLDNVVQASASSSNQVNTPVRPDSFDVTITESTYVGKNANTNSLVRMTHIPGYNMKEAFPTFKLFLMEDNSQGLINAYDNFYSYSSVLDIEIIRFMDKPDMARIQISNLANILQHRLFNQTAQGKWELEQFKREFMTLTPGGAPATGQENTAEVAGKTFSTQLYSVEQLRGYDLRDGRYYDTPQRVPLQYAVLQPGTKIQVRMGYSNNPDLLTPVFTGRVTAMEGEEILTIEAESYLAELCDIPVKDDKPVNGKKYGGAWPWHDAGDVASVVESLIRMDSAKHFGGFKLATVSDQIIQGFTWQNRLGKMIGKFSVSPDNSLALIGAAMASSYDRSGENILINHVINNLGTPTTQRLTRDFYDESTGPFDLYYQFDYQLPDNSTKTTWDYIRDICRRYPEYLVLSKQYGFPYSADASLVVAHPLDWYYARLPLIGDDETFRAGQTANAEFQTWWGIQGQQAWNAMLEAIKTDKDIFFRLNPPTPTNPQEFADTLTRIRIETQQFVGTALLTNNAAINYADQLLGTIADALGSPSLISQANAAAAEVEAVERLWEQYVLTQNPQASDRLKPVRRYHFIDHQSIVHNSMRLNEKIHNAIRIGKDTAKVNNNIPSHYTRVLDVTDLLIQPDKNVEPYGHIVRSVQQSFMREEVGKMYEGEIVLRGIPEVEPGDCLVLQDPSTSIVGIVLVEKVIQSFSQETGYTTIVYPRCMTAVNESATANMGRMFSMVMGKSVSQIVGGLGQITTHAGALAKSADGIAVVATAATVGAGIALIGAPPLDVLLGLAAIGIYGGMLWAGFKNETANMITVMPVTRWARPWIGGLEGYKVSDMWENLQNAFSEFKYDEIYPLLDTWQFLQSSQSNTLPVSPNPTAPPQ